MRAWYRRRRADRALEKARRAQDRLHGRRSSVPRRRGGSDDIGEFIVDVLLALPRAVLWIVSKILD